MRSALHRPRLLALPAALLPAAAIVYLSLRGGGYADDVQQQTAIAVWYLIFLGLVLGFLPRTRPGRETVVAGALVAGFALWTGLSSLWSESPEQSFRAFGLALLYVGVFAVVATTARRGSWRYLMGGMAIGVAVVAAVAAVSRMVPQWLPEDQSKALLADAESRLSYPIAYWNALSFFVAAGIPLLLHFTVAGRTARVRALAVAALPVCGLTLYMTYSRGGLVGAGLALLLYLALSPWRLNALVPAALAAAGATVLIELVKSSDELANGELTTNAAHDQGRTLLIVTLGITALVFALARAYAGRYGRDRLPDRPRRPVGRRAVAAGAGLVVVAAVALFALGVAGTAWDDFRNPEIAAIQDPTDAGSAQQRLSSGSGHGRYQFWEVAVNSFADHPLLGSGAATWEFTWAQKGKFAYYVRNAHSLPMDTLSELGAVGLILLLALLGYPLWVGARRYRTVSAERRAAIAALLGMSVALTVGFAIDWIWKVPATAALWFVAAALLVGIPSDEEPATDAEETPRPRGTGRYASGALVIAFAWIAIAAEVIPLLSDNKVAASEAAVRAGDFDRAVSDARSARAIEPWSVKPRVQEALAEARRGDLPAAIYQGTQATKREPHDWRNWVVLARFYLQANRRSEAFVTLSIGRTYNPKSSLLQESTYP